MSQTLMTDHVIFTIARIATYITRKSWRIGLMSLRMSPKSSSTVEAFETNGTRPRHRRPARLKKRYVVVRHD